MSGSASLIRLAFPQLQLALAVDHRLEALTAIAAHHLVAVAETVAVGIVGAAGGALELVEAPPGAEPRRVLARLFLLGLVGEKAIEMILGHHNPLRRRGRRRAAA